MIELHKYINYHGPEWNAQKQWLEAQRELKVRFLIGSTSEKKSDILRGQIGFIETLLATEEAARKAAEGN